MKVDMGYVGEEVSPEDYSQSEIGVGDTSFDMKQKDPLLSSWIFVGGISTVTLLLSIAIGIFLTKKRIRKGIELYED